jgi:hypothetical protein
LSSAPGAAPFDELVIPKRKNGVFEKVGLAKP